MTGSCGVCASDGVEVKSYHRSGFDPTRHSDDCKEILLCELCRSTPAGNLGMLYRPGHSCYDHEDVLRTINFAANKILSALEKIHKEQIRQRPEYQE